MAYMYFVLLLSIRNTVQFAGGWAWCEHAGADGHDGVLRLPALGPRARPHAGESSNTSVSNDHCALMGGQLLLAAGRKKKREARPPLNGVT